MPFSESTEWVTGLKGTSFFTKRWSPTDTPKAKVVFVHGFIEHVLRYDHVFSRFAEQGIEVFGFDQRGFGQTAAKTKSQGKTSWKEQFEDIDYFLSKEAKVPDGRKVFLMGHSMGGGLAFGFFTRPRPFPSAPLVTGGVILSSPLIQQTPAVATSGVIIRLGSFVGAVLPKLTLQVGVAPKDICRDPVVQEAYAKDPLCAPQGTYKGVADMIIGGHALVDEDYTRWPSQLPLLAVHGDADNVTWHDATQKLLEKTQAKDKEFKSFPGGFHELHNDPDPTKSDEINHLASWILQRS